MIPVPEACATDANTPPATSLLPSVWAADRLGGLTGAGARSNQVVLELFLLGVGEHGRAARRRHVVDRWVGGRLGGALRGALRQAAQGVRHMIADHAPGRAAGKTDGSGHEGRHQDGAAKPLSRMRYPHHARSTPAGCDALRRPALPLRGETAANSSNCARDVLLQYDQSKVNAPRRSAAPPAARPVAANAYDASCGGRE